MELAKLQERVRPRVFRAVAPPNPTEREMSQMSIQRFIPHFPATGEHMVFDRSWQNRAGVARVMGFCTGAQDLEAVAHAPETRQPLAQPFPQPLSLLEQCLFFDLHWTTPQLGPEHASFVIRLIDDGNSNEERTIFFIKIDIFKLGDALQFQIIDIGNALSSFPVTSKSRLLSPHRVLRKVATRHKNRNAVQGWIVAKKVRLLFDIIIETLPGIPKRIDMRLIDALQLHVCVVPKEEPLLSQKKI
ncbi:hypothetical protein GAY29_17510 [Azospirillum brasilense]|nr:hypothetical protein [Azospirillum brasilense]